jgi:hypothetical protein
VAGEANDLIPTAQRSNTILVEMTRAIPAPKSTSHTAASRLDAIPASRIFRKIESNKSLSKIKTT